MSTLNLPFIRSNILVQDMPKIRGEFTRSLSLEYVLSAAPRDYFFYTISDALDSFLVSVAAMRARLSFLLNLFIVDYLQASSVMLIQLIPNLWAYLLSFVGC